MAGFDLKKVDRNDLGVMGGGALVFIASFMPWWGASVRGYGSVSTSGWSAGFTAWFPILLSIALAVLVVLRVMEVYKLPQLPVGLAVVYLAASGLALLLVIIRLATIPSGGGGFGFSYGPRIGIFLGIIGIAAQAVFSFLTFKASGEKFEWAPVAPAGAAGAPPAPPAAPAQPMTPPAPEADIADGPSVSEPLA